MKEQKYHPSEEYARNVRAGRIPAGKYVKKQCRATLTIWEGKDKKYCLNEKLRKKIDKILKVLKMPKGPAAGQSIYKSLAGYQWFLIVAVLCTVERDNPRMRKYQTALLEIARKNGKTFDVALIFLILFYTEPAYSRFFSVAPDGQLAREIKEALEPLIRENSWVFEDGEFKILRDYILHNPTRTKYTPLNFSTNRLDGKEPTVFIADEVGALPNSYAVEAMRSGQLLVRNKLGFVISTKYPSIDNPLEDEVDYAKRVLDGIEKKENYFALLYEPDKTKDWMKSDLILKQANPLALEVDNVWKDLIEKRQRAIAMESTRENFLTKHCNIIYAGAGSETFVSVEAVQKCKVDAIDWKGQEVWVGVDLSMTNDNTSVSFVGEKEGKIYAESFAFIPEDRIEEKTIAEKTDYRLHAEHGKCIPCGGLTIDYAVVEDFVFQIEKRFNVRIMAIGFDRYNALSSAQKWDQKYTTVEIKQHSSVLHPPTKLLYEKIMSGEFAYTENKLLEINFQNAQCTFDTNLNRYVNKKKSNGKVDMVVSIINALYLLQQDRLLNPFEFVSQVV